MSLDWNLSEIENREEVCWIEEEDGSKRLNPVTEVLILSTMTVGMHAITHAGLDEFIGRFRVVEKLQGPFLVKAGGEDWWVSDEDFIAHIGLSTNASNETRAAWSRRMFNNKQTSIVDDYARSFRRAQNRISA
jgi:hypothetical protein